MVLPRSTPLAEGVDPRGVLALLDAIEASGLEFHSLMIARHGRVIAEGWWTPYRPDRVHLGYSLSKSFTATAIGVLVDAGQVGLDDVVLDYFPWIDRAGVDPNWSAVRVRHCLSMTIGHTEDMWLPAEEQQGPAGAGAVPDPFVAAIFALPVPCVPGSVFAYNQVATYLLSAVVREVTGAGLLELLAAAVFQPLGIDDALWVTTPWGLELGFSGIHVTTESILGLAQLYLDNGVAGRQRVLSEAWVAEATRATGAPRAEPGDSGPDWLQGYGFSFWQSRHGYRGDGAYGQFAIVLPEQEMCIAITAEAADMQAQLDLLWEHLLPAIDRTSAAAEDDELADRLARLSLEPLASPGPGPHSGSWPASGVLSDPGEPIGDAVLSVRREGPGWSVTFERIESVMTDAADGGVGHQVVNLIAGDGVWVESEVVWGDRVLPVVASAGWDDDRFAADIRLIETPHTLQVHASGDSATARWREGQVPLMGPWPFASAVRRRD